MTITIAGNNGEFIYNIVADGEKCSILEQDSERILIRSGKISIQGNANTEDKTCTAQCACNHAKPSECR